jgi:hypothetical protein
MPIYVLRWQLWGWISHLFGNWQCEIELANVICTSKEFTKWFCRCSTSRYCKSHCTVLYNSAGLSSFVDLQSSYIHFIHYPYKYCRGQSVPDTVSNIMHYLHEYCRGHSVPDTLSNIIHYIHKYCGGQSVPVTVSNKIHYPYKYCRNSLYLTQYQIINILQFMSYFL